MNTHSTPYPSRSHRNGFTLVELLLVIAIIAILASLGVGVMAQAQNDAAIASTRSRVSMIQKILEIELENYEVRRSPIPFAGIGAIISASSLDNTGGTRTLLHAKNLKRMIIADLIRAEMPDGSVTGLTANNEIVLGEFPSRTLVAYLEAIGVTAPATYFPSPPPSVTGWTFFDPDPLVVAPATPGLLLVTDNGPGDGVDTDAANKAELLYQVLLNINVDGVPAIDQIGSQAIGDSDADGVLEVIDAWGEPLYLQWQQEQLSIAATSTVPENEWESANNFVGLSLEHADLSVGHGAIAPYCTPVLPTQIRPFLISERLLKIDGLPVNFDATHSF